jgi:oligoendopeptidase F
MSQKYPWNWNLDSYYPSIESAEYKKAWVTLETSADSLALRAADLGALTVQNAASWAQWILDYETMQLEARHIGSFITCLVSVDALNEAYKKESARMFAFAPKSRKVLTLLETFVGKATEEAFQALINNPLSKNLDYPLFKVREEAALSLPPDQQYLLADLAVDGASAWTRLYGHLTGKMTFELKVPGQATKILGLGECRSLLGDGNIEVRKAALKGANEALEKSEDVFAAALNALIGWRITTHNKRGEVNDLAPAMRAYHIELESVEAMFSAIRKRIELPRSILKLKAKALQLKQLGFHDLEAPLPDPENKKFSWDAACELMLHSFQKHYPALHGFSLNALKNKWIDAEPRKSRRPGGFCSTSPKIGESRIFMSYGDNLGDMQTLSHELGHAYHGQVLNGIRLLSRAYPSTLAETASTFAQILVAKDVAGDSKQDKQTRLQMLMALLNDDHAFCLNIFMRYEFEKKLFIERRKGDVSVSKLKSMMAETQADIYGDSLDPAQLDPYFWASKLHFYGYSFYNFPYTFGYLLSRIFSRKLREDGPKFLEVYEEFLRGTGMYSCEDLVKRTLGQDIRTEGFWNQALDEMQLDLNAFEKEL